MARQSTILPRLSKSASLLYRRTEPPVVSLDLPQLDRCHDRAERALTKTIAAYGKLGQDIDPTKWKCLRSRQGIRLSRGARVSCGDQTPLLCVGTLHGRFDDVMEGIYCDNTDEMLLMNTIKCPRLAGSSVIHTVQQQSADEPFVFTEIKSTTIKVSVASNRDFHYFDKMGMVRQRSRKRMAYHVMQSVDLPEIPQKPTYKRVKASLCYLFEELEDDLVGVYMQGSTNYTALSYFARIAVSDVLLAQIDNALDCTRAKKLALIMSMNCLDVSRQKSCRKKTCYVCKGKPFLRA